MRRRNPCKQCSHRTPGCHAECGEYKDWRLQLDAHNEVVKENRAAYHNHRVTWTKSRKKLAMKDR